MGSDLFGTTNNKVSSADDVMDDAIAAIEQTHTYDLPEIMARAVLNGSAAYLNWINSETSSPWLRRSIFGHSELRYVPMLENTTTCQVY